MVYWAYNLILTLVLILLAPALPLFFLLRARWLDGFANRLGHYSPKVRRLMDGTRPVWIHAVSAGEVLSMESLAKAIRKTFPDRKVLVSSSTATGVEMARKMGAADATIFFPLDYPLIVRRALRAFDPALVIFLETEIWPNYLWLAHRRGIPVLLLSGRISARSLRRYRWFSWLFGRAVRYFSALGMQTESDARRMAALGVDRSKLTVTGSLKYDIDRTTTGNGNGKFRGEFLAEGPSPRRLWVAGSTHDGEESIILDVYGALKGRFPGLMLVLAPRHPHRFGNVEKLLQQRRVCYVKKSEVADRMPPIDVLLLDSMGELLSFYALADATFVGGSLVNVGGHNILEPARLGKPVFFGPYMSNFAEAAAEMVQKGGGVTVRTKEELARELGKVLADSHLAEAMGDSAHCVVARHGGVLAQSMQLVSRYLG